MAGDVEDVTASMDAFVQEGVNHVRDRCLRASRMAWRRSESRCALVPAEDFRQFLQAAFGGKEAASAAVVQSLAVDDSDGFQQRAAALRTHRAVRTASPRWASRTS